MTIGIIWLSCQSKIDNQQAGKNKTLAINDTITKPIDSIIKSNFIAEDKPQVQPPSVIPTPIIPMEIAELVIVDSPNLIPIQKKDSNSIYSEIEVDEKPKFIHSSRDFIEFVNINFSYPGHDEYLTSSEIIIEFTILKDGTVTDMVILKSSGYKSLDNECCRILKLSNQKWHPARKNGATVNCRMKQQIIFDLDED